MQDDMALVVGINHYPLAAGIAPLGGAVRDAEKFFKWVIDPMGGDVPDDEEHRLLLKSSDNVGPTVKPRPVFPEIHTFFSDMQFRLGNRTGRRLYIYLSGHGISPTGQESIRNAALLMADSRPPGVWNSFPGNVWAEGARSAARFREVVLIMDCCRDLKNNAIVMPHIFGDPVPDSKDCRLVEAYAAGWASKAREGEFGPAKEKQGIFTHSLLQVLGAGKMNGRLLKESVRAYLKRLATEEHPYREPEIGKDEELAALTFSERANPPMTSVTIRNHPASPPQIEFWAEDSDQSSLVNVDDWSFSGTEWQGVLSPGLYELRLLSGRGKRIKVLAGVPAEVDL